MISNIIKSSIILILLLTVCDLEIDLECFSVSRS